MPEPPRCDMETTRIAVVDVLYPLVGGSGWPIRLVHDAKVAITLVAVRPPDVSESKPPCVARTILAEPVLRVGTIDELVAAYREDLEKEFNHANQDPSDRDALRITEESFADVVSGRGVPPLFGGTTR